MTIAFHHWEPEWSSVRWFNVSGPTFVIRHRQRVNFVWLWNAFNRYTADGEHWWGFGLFQVGNRHLFFVGFCGVSIAFIGRTT